MSIIPALLSSTKGITKKETVEGELSRDRFHLLIDPRKAAKIAVLLEVPVPRSWMREAA